MAFDPIIISPTSSLPYWATQSKEVSTTVQDSGAAVTGCNRAQLVFTRTTPTGLREDVMVINTHVYKIAGAFASFFTGTSDLNAAKTPITDWWTAQKVYHSTQVTFREIRWYVVRDDQDDSGPPVRVDTVGVAGTAANVRAPDQLSPTITLITASRKHWGRWYLPGVTRDFYETTYGRASTATIDTMAANFRTMALALETAGFNVCVWSPTARSVLDLYKIQMDDVPDVQRRRRPKQPNYRKVFTS